MPRLISQAHWHQENTPIMFHTIRQKLRKSGSRNRSTKNDALSSALPQPPQLCTRCLSIDFEKIYLGEIPSFYDSGGKTIRDLGSVEALAASTCSLCQLFATVAEPTDSVSNGSLDWTSTRYLRVTNAEYVFEVRRHSYHKPGEDTILFFVSSSDNSFPTLHQRYFCFHQPSRNASQLGVRLVSRESFDVSHMSSCLNYCVANHGTNCNLQGTRPLNGLRVIDCETRTIITAPPSCQYVALSYVWGLSREDNPAETTDMANVTTLDGCPKTINDAMAVTKKFNKKYLWVDRYCINQSDEVEVVSQVSQMDLIYTNAYLCIIAAAGDGPNHGLPGVNGTLRTQQPTLAVGKYVLASTLNHPKRALDASKWASRGWTYQEGILSKR